VNCHARLGLCQNKGNHADVRADIEYDITIPDNLQQLRNGTLLKVTVLDAVDLPRTSYRKVYAQAADQQAMPPAPKDMCMDEAA
jgi:hypothetical protein